MYEVDLASPNWGLDDGTDALELATQGQRDLWALGIDPAGLNPFEAKIAADVLAEVDAMSDDELAALTEGQEAKWDASWMDALPDDRFHDIMAEIKATGADPEQYMDFSRGIETTLAAMTDREHVRQVEDSADREQRTGPHHNRPSAEVALSNALDRIGRGTYLYGESPVDLTNDPDLEALLDTGLTPTPAEIRDELAYHLLGQGTPIARRYREPLPPVQNLAKRIGLTP